MELEETQSSACAISRRAKVQIRFKPTALASQHVRIYIYFKSIVGINGTDYGSIPGKINKAQPRKATLLDWERLLWAVSKTGCGVEGRRHEKKRAGVAASIENLLSSRHVNVLRNSVYRGQQCEIT
ncbi:hypothetical protein C0J52_27767 [Blattella germanica]|nr:hypothetical protein C0J52_27767 [Blattella germanica]